MQTGNIGDTEQEPFLMAGMNKKAVMLPGFRTLLATTFKTLVRLFCDPLGLDWDIRIP